MQDGNKKTSNFSNGEPTEASAILKFFKTLKPKHLTCDRKAPRS